MMAGEMKMLYKVLLLLCLAAGAAGDATPGCGQAYVELDAGASININSPDYSTVQQPCYARILIVPPTGYHVMCQPTANCFLGSALRNTVDLIDGNVADLTQPPVPGFLAACPTEPHWGIVRSSGRLSIQTGLFSRRQAANIVPILTCTAEQDGPTNCGGDLFLSAFNPYDAYFYTTGWPNNYFASSSCTWNVILEAGSQVQMVCDQFSTEAQYDLLRWQYSDDDSDIMNPCDQGDPVMGTGAACSNGWIGGINTASYLTFVSDGSVQRSGFRCRMQATSTSSMRQLWTSMAKALPTPRRLPVAQPAAAKPITSAVLNGFA